VRADGDSAREKSKRTRVAKKLALPRSSPARSTPPSRRRPSRLARRRLMESIWMGIAPSARGTRVVAMSGPSETFLKAQLDPEPRHPRALSTLLEAVALWQGLPVRAALSVDDRGGSCASRLYR